MHDEGVLEFMLGYYRQLHGLLDILAADNWMDRHELFGHDQRMIPVGLEKEQGWHPGGTDSGGVGYGNGILAYKLLVHSWMALALLIRIIDHNHRHELHQFHALELVAAGG